MAISVYSGVMGSGKTYEAILNGVLPAIKAGRRVVTNISGIDSEKIRQFLVKGGSQLEQLGHVLHVSNDTVAQLGFFPGEGPTRLKFEVPDFVPLRELQHYADEYVLAHGKNFTKVSFQLLLPELKRLHERGIDLGSCLVEAAHREWRNFEAAWFLEKVPGEVFAQISETGPSVVQPGDFVVIDEAWRYWSASEKLSSEHMNFFRMHRHYVGTNGVACDLLVIIQDFASLHRFLKGVCELVLIFQKLKVLGFGSRYRVEVYEGKPSKRSLVSTSPIQKYDQKIFPLYKSYDGAHGQESRTDDRQNLFKNRFFIFAMIFGLALFGYGGKWLYSFLSRVHGNEDSQSKSPASLATASSPDARFANKPLPGKDKSLLPSDVRLVSVLEPSVGETILVFQLSDGRYVRKSMKGGFVDGWQSVAAFDGRMIGFAFGGNK
jgi:zona occludens toxin (predicted ATPase)